MSDANTGAAAKVQPAKKGGGWLKWLACGCVVLILLGVLAVAVAVFVSYKGFGWMKRQSQQAGAGYLQGNTPGGQALSEGRFDPVKMQRILDASEEWPQIKTYLDSGDMASLNAMARRRGFDNAIEMNLYFSAAVGIGSQILSGSHESAREMFKDVYGEAAVDVVARPENLEKVRRYIGYP
jgi:hypothetical protein